MASLEELVTQHQAQGKIVAELKQSKDPSVKAAVTILLDTRY